MKRFIPIFLTLLLFSIPLASCADKQNETKTDPKTQVITEENQTDAGKEEISTKEQNETGQVSTENGSNTPDSPATPGTSKESTAGEIPFENASSTTTTTTKGSSNTTTTTKSTTTTTKGSSTTTTTTTSSSKTTTTTKRTGGIETPPVAIN